MTPLNVAKLNSHSPTPEFTPDRRVIAVLGATGTIGRSTIDVALRHPDRYRIAVVTANDKAEDLARIAVRCGAERAVVANEAAYGRLKAALSGTGVRAEAGEVAMNDAVAAPVDFVMAGIVGVAGLRTAYQAARRGIAIGLANKECLVSAAPLFQTAVETSGATIIPIDSEHSAVFQALSHASVETVEKITITASGGPFRTWSRQAMAAITPDMAVAHPNWSMGAKISVDSATLMNKGLELIEAAALFPFAANALEVIVHPQSVVHGMVTFSDGSALAQLGAPDMRTPIAVGLAWPDRIAVPASRLDLIQIARLDFEEPDRQRFPALRLAETALAAGNVHCIALNAANEVAVDYFLRGRLPFLKIADIVEDVVSMIDGSGDMEAPSSMDDVLFLDNRARGVAVSRVKAAG